MRNHAFSIVAAALTVSFVTAAQPDSPKVESKLSTPPQSAPAADAPPPALAPATVTEAKTVTQTVEPEKKKLPFAGTQVVYGHSSTAFTLVPNAEPLYNPTWVHHIDLAPRWNFNDDFAVSALWSVEQEFTLSDTTATRNEFELADLRLSGHWKGWQESVTGIRLAADLRFIFPVSKRSLAQTRVVSIGPGVNVSRDFKVLSNLKLAYGVRPTYRFHRYTTMQFNNPDPNQTPEESAKKLPPCTARRDPECFQQSTSGIRNVPFDLTHGPSLALDITETIGVEASFAWSYGWLYPLTAPTKGPSPLEFTDTGVRYLTNFTIAANWQVTKAVGLSLGANTLGTQLGADGRYIFPLFNRNTTLYLDASFDVEAFVSGLN